MHNCSFDYLCHVDPVTLWGWPVDQPRSRETKRGEPCLTGATVSGCPLHIRKLSATVKASLHSFLT